MKWIDRLDESYPARDRLVIMYMYIVYITTSRSPTPLNSAYGSTLRRGEGGGAAVYKYKYIHVQSKPAIRPGGNRMNLSRPALFVIRDYEVCTST